MANPVAVMALAASRPDLSITGHSDLGEPDVLRAIAHLRNIERQYDSEPGEDETPDLQGFCHLWGSRDFFRARSDFCLASNARAKNHGRVDREGGTLSGETAAWKKHFTRLESFWK